MIGGGQDDRGGSVLKILRCAQDDRGRLRMIGAVRMTRGALRKAKQKETSCGDVSVNVLLSGYKPVGCFLAF